MMRSYDDTNFPRTEKYMIVEGKTDKQQLERLLDERVQFICTHGTLGQTSLDELVEEIEGEDIYILVDADDSGNKLRQQLKRELPTAKHLYTRKIYKEVAHTPIEYLVKILDNAHFEIKEHYRILLTLEDETKK